MKSSLISTISIWSGARRHSYWPPTTEGQNHHHAWLACRGTVDASSLTTKSRPKPQPTLPVFCFTPTVPFPSLACFCSPDNRKNSEPCVIGDSLGSIGTRNEKAMAKCIVCGRRCDPSFRRKAIRRPSAIHLHNTVPQKIVSPDMSRAGQKSPVL
jgi:hypothetical protein